MGHVTSIGEFPFCVTAYPGGYVNHTTGSLDVVMKSYWVLRKFSISGTYLDGASVTQSFSITLKNPSSSEDQIVCDPAWVVDTSSNLNTINGSWYSNNSFYKDGSLIVPDYSISALYQNGGGSGFSIVSLDASGYPQTFLFEGMTFYGTDGGALTFTLTPIEYWSYGGTYNTSTGAKL